MPWPSTPRDIAARITPALGGGCAGTLTALMAIHKPSTVVLAGVAAISALAVNAVKSICKALPEIIKATADATARVIQELAEASVLMMRTRTETKLLRAGINPEKAAQAQQMLMLRAINVHLPADRRLNDAAIASLIRLFASLGTRNARRRPGTGPRKPGNGSRKPGSGPWKQGNVAADNVFPIQPVK